MTKNNKCLGCGALLHPDTVVCPHCGRLVGQNSNGVGAASPPRTENVRNTKKAKKVKKAEPAYVRFEPEADERYEKPKRKKSRAVNLLYRLLTVAIVIAGAYIAIFAVQVFRIKVSKYDFETEVKMSQKNYGQAIEGYFDSGKWSVNPFTGICTYKGETKHGDEYEIVFSARLKVNVQKIIVDGKEVDKKQIETRMMGMFI